jgi:hypothetical protein
MIRPSDPRVRVIHGPYRGRSGIRVCRDSDTVFVRVDDLGGRPGVIEVNENHLERS